MNQILVTGEEENKKIKEKKERKVIDIKKIVIFFSISIIFLGICIICTGVYSKIKIKETMIASATPEVLIERNDDNNTIEVKVSHIKGIKYLTYKWNDEEEVIINGNNQNTINQTIDLIGGVNTLTVTATDETDKTVTYQKEYTAGNIPEISLQAVQNGVKVISSCEDEIEKIIYDWDGQESQTIEVNSKNYEGIINTLKGKHTLNIKVINKNGIEATKTQTVIGDTEPSVDVVAELSDNGVEFVINVEDDEKITKIEVTLNDQEKEVIEVNDIKFNKRIKMEQGENKLLVTAYNLNGLQKTVGRKFNNN